MSRPSGIAGRAWPFLAVLFLTAWAVVDGEGPARGDTAERVRSMYESYRQTDFPDVPDLSAATAIARADSSWIVDVRGQRERDVSTISGAVDLPTWREQWEAGDRRPVVVYCTIGVRSARVTRELREEGVEAFNLAGGILAWVHSGGEVIDPVDGAPTRRVHVYGRRWSLLPDSFQRVW